MKITKDLIITNENKNDYKKLKECGKITIMDGVKSKFPVLTTCGNVDLSESASFDAPVLTTCGNVDLSESASFVTKQTKKLKYKSVDNKMFVIESEKTSKGIKILTGYNLIGITKSKIQKEACYVAEKDNFFAHGETVKKAISDLQFKIVSETLKSAPIKADTIIDIKYYRLITGSCQMGVDSFIKQHGLRDSYKAKDLLPILEKNNAYGLERFKKLITF
jgi:hypothetical protein